MRTSLAVTTIFILFAFSIVYAGDNMKAFPPPNQGQLRYVIELPEFDDESNYKIELIVGKMVEVDDKNQYFYGGKIEKENIVGWGFTRYVVNELGPMAGTLMAIDPNAPKVDRFVQIGGEPYLIRYNSRLPIVVYVPEGAEVRYRIWSADPNAQNAKEG